MPTKTLVVPGVVLCLAVASLASAPSAPEPSGVASHRVRSAAVCTERTFHPIEVTVDLQENLEPDTWVAARVTVTSRLDHPRATVDLRSRGGLAFQGATTRSLGAVAAGQPVSIEVLVRVPDQLEPGQLVVTVEADHEGGQLRRGTTLNLLPRGPHHPAVADRAVGKTRTVLEYPGAARRVK